ncbi:hypothetical protein [Stratiformator vulcanicus]|uniref:Uncharacterized protein n=1 Tax=Stratiformator vulcanicus TaxID=2527980 RepID=A0A517R531_9PLAN|nr:hypothetical protein [Stratiformator vulcanicus]QDT38991.1 hypothetical protein Pan189_33920 [Stratiformator vulcanicus]
MKIRLFDLRIAIMLACGPLAFARGYLLAKWGVSIVDYVFLAATASLLVMWIIRDAHTRGETISLGTQQFLFFLHVIAVPVYWIWHHGWRGLGGVLLFVALYYAFGIGGGISYMVIAEVSGAPVAF